MPPSAALACRSTASIADTNVALACDRPGVDYNCAGSYDQIVQFNNQVPIGFETYGYMLPTKTEFLWGLLNGMDKKADYIRMSSFENLVLPGGVPNTDYTNLMNWANQWIGKDLTDTPSVWVAMRDHRNPFRYGTTGDVEYTSEYPQVGNFQFWLYQRDDAPNARTVPETNQATEGGQPVGLGLCPAGAAGPPGYPCFANAHNPALPDSASEAWVIRRTDQSTNNPLMAFSIDDGYIYGLNNQVEIKVTYWNSGSGPLDAQLPGQRRRAAEGDPCGQRQSVGAENQHRRLRDRQFHADRHPVLQRHGRRRGLRA